MLREEHKKKKMYEDMLEQFELKDKLRIEAEARDRAELKRLSEYQSRLDDRDKRQKEEKKKK